MSNEQQNQRRRQIRSVLWAVVIIGFLGGLVSAAQRWRVESRNRSVEITLDFQEMRSIAVAEGKPLSEVLRRFQEAGATSIALQEDAVGGLEEGRQVEIVAGDSPETVLVKPQTPEIADRIKEALDKKLGRTTTPAPNAGPNAFFVPLPHNALRSLGLGLDPRLVKEIHDARLGIVGRVANYNGVRPEGIEWILKRLKADGVQTVIFFGDEALGYKGYLTQEAFDPGAKTTDVALRDVGLNIGAVEFSKQKGDDTLSKAAADRVVRVHTVLGAEMLTATIDGNIQRFELAARERNIRLLFVRLFLDEKGPLEKNATGYVKKLADGLEGSTPKQQEQQAEGQERSGLVLGPAHPYEPLSTSLPLRGIIAIGIAAAWLLLVDSFTRFLRNWAGTGVGIVAFGGALLLLALPLAPMLLGAKLAAFAAAVIYPTLALLHSDLIERMQKKAGLLSTLGEFLRSCAITGLGVAAIVGLLADRLFLVKVDSFIGVKAANLLPAMIVWLAYALPLRATNDWTFKRALDETRERLMRIAEKPVLIWQVIIAIVGIAALALLVLRTGNDPGVGVSGFELKIRAVLDQILYTRPRFKEFLIGHPALVLAFLAAARGRRDLAVPLIAVGAIGQASMLGSFCHLHTPLLVSLVRALLGIIIGAIIGVVIYQVILMVERRRSSSGAAANPAGATATTTPTAAAAPSNAGAGNPVGS